MAARKRGSPVRVLLADDHPLILEGLRRYLSRRRDIVVVGEAADGEEAVAMAVELEADVVLMDVDMPKMGGKEATRRLARSAPDARVVALTGQGMAHAADMARAGAWGYLMKSAKTLDVAQTILAVAAGERLLDERTFEAESDELAQLTPREREVLVLVAKGLSNKEIGKNLQIGVRTVETHRENLTRKLGLRGAAALTKWALARGLVDLD